MNMKGKILTREQVKELGLDKVSVSALRQMDEIALRNTFEI